MILKELKTNTIKELYSSVLNIQKVLKTAIIERDKLVDFNSYNDMKRNQDLIKITPDDFYYFKYFNYGFSIVRMRTSFNTDLMEFTRCKDFHYHIALFGFNLTDFQDLLKKYPELSEHYIGLSLDYLGDFLTFEEAKKSFDKIIPIFISWLHSKELINNGLC